MTVSELTHILQKPQEVSAAQAEQLDKILLEFPYFQSARSLYLKSLHKQDSFKYNPALKTTAAYTTDRSILFDFITSSSFTIQALDTKPDFTQTPTKVGTSFLVDHIETETTSLENTIENSILATISIANEEIEPKVEETVFMTTENPLEKSILSSIQEAEQDELETKEEEKPLLTVPETTTEQPVTFERNETHSFQEWLQLAKSKPISRKIEEVNEAEQGQNLSSKLEIIDRFIETNPKISPPKEDVKPPLYTRKNEDTSYLMTETLAKIYLEQKKYNKAIQAYEILILKYPEKSSLFADRILDIKSLQQNNNS